MASPGAELCISNLVHVTGMLKNIIAPSFGPSCRPTLLTNNTGQVVFSNDSYTIFSSLSLSHPVAKCLVETLKVHHGVCGDGGKTLILYIHEALRAIENNYEALSSGSQGAASKSFIPNSLTKFIGEDLSSVCDNLHRYLEKKTVPCEAEDSENQMLQSVIKTAISGNLPNDVVCHIATLLSDFFAGIMQCDEKATIFYLCFQNCVKIFRNKPYLSSHIGEGMYFQCELNHQQVQSAGITQFVFLLCPIEGFEEDKGEYFIAMKTETFNEDILCRKTRAVESFVLTLQKARVSLIVTSHKVPDFVLHICNKFSIVVVSCLEKEDMEFISFYSGKSPVTSTHDKLEDINICMAESWQQVCYSGKTMLKMIFPSHIDNWQAKFLFLYAPTDGFCQQLKSLIRNCFKAVLSLMIGSQQSSYKFIEALGETETSEVRQLVHHKRQDIMGMVREQRVLSFPNSNIIAGGGYFEILLSLLLENHSKQMDSVEKRIWAHVLTQMLQAVPHALFSNLSSPFQGKQASGFISAWKESRELVQDNKVVGFNSKGLLCDPRTSGVLDILSVKLDTCYVALGLVVKLLCVDSIVGVKHVADGKEDVSSDSDYD